MSVEKWWNEICGRGKWENPRENYPPPFRPLRSPHGVTETRTRDPSGGSEHLIAYATRPPPISNVNKSVKLSYAWWKGNKCHYLTDDYLCYK